MRVSDIFEQRKQPFSVETFPPKGDYPMEKFRKVCGALKELKPEFMSVTYSAGGSGNSGRTAVLAQMAKEEYGLNSVAHLTCINSTDEEIRAVVEDMKAGESFTENNVRSIRPYDGLSPKYLDEILGKKAARDISRGTPLSWELTERLS